MSYTYTFNVPNILYLDLLTNYLYTTTLPINFYINYSFNYKLDIVYATQLTSDQITLLTNTINNYTPPQTEEIITLNENTFIYKDQFNSNESNVNIYLSILVYNFLYNIHTEDKLSYVYVYSYINSGSYKLRVFDITNNTVLAESGNLTNRTLVKNILPITSSFTNDALIEVQCLVLRKHSNYYIQLCNFIFTQIL